MLRPGYASLYNNLGATFQALGQLVEAEKQFKYALAKDPRNIVVFWNLIGLEKTISGAEFQIDRCLKIDGSFKEALLVKAGLMYYKGDRKNFDNLKKSEYKQNPYMLSFLWFFALPKLPPMYFNKWDFFDAVIKLSVTGRPFYEFGVWRGTSFKYLINVFKKGYGFDTFTGLPEDWDVGNKVEKSGSYSNDGNVPKINGGKFIVGKFEETLPVFFSKIRPKASIVNLDADLYSSTICALNFSKKVID